MVVIVLNESNQRLKTLEKVDTRYREKAGAERLLCLKLICLGRTGFTSEIKVYTSGFLTRLDCGSSEISEGICGGAGRMP